MKYLLDANVFVHLGNHSRGYEHIAEVIRSVGIEQCALSAITAYEVRYLLLRGPGRVKRENIERLEIAFRSVRRVLPISGDVAEAAAVLRARLQQSGRDIGIHDCLTGVHAIAAGLVCVTANRKHFDRIEGLVVEDWSSGNHSA